MPTLADETSLSSLVVDICHTVTDTDIPAMRFRRDYTVRTRRIEDVNRPIVRPPSQQ